LRQRRSTLLSRLLLAFEPDKPNPLEKKNRRSLQNAVCRRRVPFSTLLAKNSARRRITRR
jgi:hypothetical protein